MSSSGTPILWCWRVWVSRLWHGSGTGTVSPFPCDVTWCHAGQGTGAPWLCAACPSPPHPPCHGLRLSRDLTLPCGVSVPSQGHTSPRTPLAEPLRGVLPTCVFWGGWRSCPAPTGHVRSSLGHTLGGGQSASRGAAARAPDGLHGVGAWLRRRRAWWLSAQALVSPAPGWHPPDQHGSFSRLQCFGATCPHRAAVRRTRDACAPC